MKQKLIAPFKVGRITIGYDMFEVEDHAVLGAEDISPLIMDYLIRRMGCRLISDSRKQAEPSPGAGSDQPDQE